MGNLGSGLGKKVQTPWEKMFGSHNAATRASQQNLKAIARYGNSPEFLNWVKKALPGLLGMYEPTRVAETDQAAMGEQNNLRAINALAGRTGMSGSGAAMMARQGVRGERQASVNESLISMYQKAIAEAYKQAGQTLGTLQSGLAGQAYPAQQGQSIVSPTIASNAQEGIGKWLAMYQKPATTYKDPMYGSGALPGDRYS